MINDDNLYNEFLNLMGDLEGFRREYSSLYPHIPIEREDPDIKRLIEAIAFFSARTHIASKKNLSNYRLRIFKQILPYVLSPVPAMTMLRAEPTGLFSETTFVPMGTEIAIVPETTEPIIFTTLNDIRILPIKVTSVDTIKKGADETARILITMNAAYPRNDDVELLSFYINYLDDFKSSLQVSDMIRKNLIKSTVFFDENVDEDSSGKMCDVFFDNPPVQTDTSWLHPIEKHRFFLRFPEQALYLNVDVNDTPRNWQQITICLDLNCKWPRSMPLNKNSFQLFTVPIINLQRSMSESFIYDGTKQNHPIKHSDYKKKFEAYSVVGVYQVLDNRLSVIEPGIISKTSGSYEVEKDSYIQGQITKHWLLLYYPEAFENPVTFVVDCLWHQPFFSEVVSQKLTPVPYNRNIVGVKWELVGDVVVKKHNAFIDNADGLLHILSLKNKMMLNLEDIKTVLNMLGNLEKRKFNFINLIKSVEVDESVVKGKAESSNMIKHIYYFDFKKFEFNLEGEIEMFCALMERILNSWISNKVVEVRMRLEKKEI